MSNPNDPKVATEKETEVLLTMVQTLLQELQDIKDWGATYDGESENTIANGDWFSPLSSTSDVMRNAKGLLAAWDFHKGV